MPFKNLKETAGFSRDMVEIDSPPPPNHPLFYASQSDCCVFYFIFIKFKHDKTRTGFCIVRVNIKKKQICHVISIDVNSSTSDILSLKKMICFLLLLLILFEIESFIVVVVITGNNFSRLHRGDFESVPQVRLLLLDDSHIVEIEEDALGRMDLLEELSLNGNQLANIPASLPSTSLSSLHLEGNRITALRAADFIGLRRLDQLHLASNVIVSIATGTFDQLTRLVRPF